MTTFSNLFDPRVCIKKAYKPSQNRQNCHIDCPKFQWSVTLLATPLIALFWKRVTQIVNSTTLRDRSFFRLSIYFRKKNQTNLFFCNIYRTSVFQEYWRFIREYRNKYLRPLNSFDLFFRPLEKCSDTLWNNNRKKNIRLKNAPAREEISVGKYLYGRVPLGYKTHRGTPILQHFSPGTVDYLTFSARRPIQNSLGWFSPGSKRWGTKMALRYWKLKKYMKDTVLSNLAFLVNSTKKIS